MSVGKRRRFRILERDDFTCRYCGRSATDVALEVDHVDPRSAGGSDEDSNLVTACYECNRGKRHYRLGPSPIELLGQAEDRWVDEWLENSRLLAVLDDLHADLEEMRVMVETLRDRDRSDLTSVAAILEALEVRGALG